MSNIPIVFIVAFVLLLLLIVIFLVGLNEETREEVEIVKAIVVGKHYLPYDYSKPEYMYGYYMHPTYYFYNVTPMYEVVVQYNYLEWRVYSDRLYYLYNIGDEIELKLVTVYNKKNEIISRYMRA